MADKDSPMSHFIKSFDKLGDVGKFLSGDESMTQKILENEKFKVINDKMKEVNEQRRIGNLTKPSPKDFNIKDMYELAFNIDDKGYKAESYAEFKARKAAEKELELGEKAKA